MKSEFIDFADKFSLKFVNLFDSKIRFPSDLTEKYLQIADNIEEKIIESYDIEVNDGIVFITEQVYNLIFKKQ